MLRSAFLFLLMHACLLTVVSACGIFVPSDDYVRTNDSNTRPDKRPKGGGEPTADLRVQIVADAAELKGTRYKYGGVNPKTGMDCSGLTNYVFQNAGISLNRSSREQAKNGHPIKLKDAQAGDLIFFQRSGRIFHVAVVARNLGDKLYVIHSTTSRGVVEQEILNDSYWKPKIAFVRDVISG